MNAEYVLEKLKQALAEEMVEQSNDSILRFRLTDITRLKFPSTPEISASMEFCPLCVVALMDGVKPVDDYGWRMWNSTIAGILEAEKGWDIKFLKQVMRDADERVGHGENYTGMFAPFTRSAFPVR